MDRLDENNIWAKSIFTKAKSIFTKAKSYFGHISSTWRGLMLKRRALLRTRIEYSDCWLEQK